MGIQVQIAFAISTVTYFRETEHQHQSKSLREGITKRKENMDVRKAVAVFYLTEFLTCCILRTKTTARPSHSAHSPGGMHITVPS